MAYLSFEPLIPPALWAALLAGSIALLGVYAWRRPYAAAPRRWLAIIALMALGLSLALIVLLNPVWIEPIEPPAGKPALTILVDSSASMATADIGDKKQTRFSQAARLAEALRAQEQERFDVRVLTFTDRSAAASVEELKKQKPTGGVTDLAIAINDSLAADRPAGQATVLFSDGIHNGGGGAPRVLDAVRAAKALGCPISTCTLGGQARIDDLAVELRTPQDLAFIKEKIPIHVALRQRGLKGATARVRLLQDGKPIESRDVPLADRERTEVRFEATQEKPGLYRYEVVADPLPGEISLANNRSLLLLRVVDEPVRVVLLEGKPYWDAKFLVRTLQLDPSVELECVVKVAEGRYHRRRLSRRPKEPGEENKEEWSAEGGEFLQKLLAPDGLKTRQIIVLGRNADVFLTDDTLAALKTWLAKDGGSVVCARGQPTAQVGEKLGALLPVRWSPGREARFKLALTERGRELQWLSPDVAGVSLEQMPTLASSAKPEAPKPLAVVLATQAGSGDLAPTPVISYQPYGGGRVVVIEGAGLWRWAFLPAQQQESDQVYKELWRNLLRWLVSNAELLPGQKTALRGDKVTFNGQEPCAATLFLREEAGLAGPPAIELRSAAEPTAQPRRFAPVPLGDEAGTYRVVFGPLPEGRYEARVADAAQADLGARTEFEVRSLSEEQLDLEARPDLMARIAQESGGAVLDAERVDKLTAQFRKHAEAQRPAKVRRTAAWDRWWILAAGFAVWTMAWAVRRRSGLV